jgi:aldose 1-epimerase
MKGALRLLAAVAVTLTCASAKSGLTSSPWGKTPVGESIFLYTLTDAAGVEARITNFGGILVSLKTPDRHGTFADVTLGFDTFEEYLKTRRYFGATVGRFANRIADAKFLLDGVAYTLARNNGRNSMHGGVRGFHKAVWQGREISSDPPTLELTYRSRDGEEGFPGNLSVTVRYTLTNFNDLRIEYTATTDKATVLNLTNHSFFNLAEQGRRDVLGHVVTIDADRFLPVDDGLIPTGELRAVAGTAFDFRKPAAAGARIDADDPQLKFAKGYDHTFVLKHATGKLGFAAQVAEPESGRVMEVYTTEPGVQFYTGNTLDGSEAGKSGNRYGPRSGLCLETQHFPDSPNQPAFPSTVLRPGATFHSTTIYRFGVTK